MFNAIKRVSSKFASYRLCSTAPAIQTEQKAFGLSRAILCGKVVRDPYVFENGMKSILLQSNNSDTGYTINRVHTSTHANITAGQYLYVAGSLKSDEFQTADGKRRHQYSVHATDTSVIGKSFQDINSVELRAVVVGDIINTNEFAQFRVLTTYIPKSKPEPTIRIFTIRAYGEELRGLVTDQVEKTHMIRIMGELRTAKVIDQNQKSRTSSYIRAFNIFLTDTSNKFASTAEGVDDLSSDSSSSEEENNTDAGKPTRE